jgi:hypothetical protein
MPARCPNHGRYGDKEKHQAMQKLTSALNLLWDGHVKPSNGVKQQLRHADVWGGVEGLEMDIVLITFGKRSKLAKQKLAFTVDLMLSKDTRDIAYQIDEVISEKLKEV